MKHGAAIREMELTNRLELEQDFSAKLIKLNEKFKQQILNEMGGSLDPSKITPELWNRVKEEYDREMKSALALLFLMSMNTHTVRRDVPLQADRYQLAALQYAHDRSSAVMPRFLLHSQETLQGDATTWETQRDVGKSLGKVFGKERAERVAQTETSAAQYDGGVAAIKIQGIPVKFRWEHSRIARAGHAGAAIDPCPICTPMLGKWHWEWQGNVPGKMHPHCDCYPAAYDLITGKPLPFEYPVESSVEFI